MNTVNKVIIGMAGCVFFLALAVLGFNINIEAKPGVANAAATWTVVKQGQFAIDCDKNLAAWPNLCASKHTFTSNISGNSAAKLTYTVASGHCASVRAHVLVDGVEKAVTPYMGHYGSLPTTSRPKTYTVELGTLSSGSHEFSLLGELDGYDCGGGNMGLASWGGDFVLSAEPSSGTGSIACNSNADCGANIYTGSLFCQSGNVHQSYTAYTCNNAGTTSAYCSSNTQPQIKTTCGSNQTCFNGSCNTSNVVCNSNADCGTNAYAGSSFCSGNSVYQNFTTYICNNPGTANSSCSSSTIGQIKFTCGGSQTCSNGNCAATTQSANLTAVTLVRNLSSGNLNWSSSVSAQPSDVLQFQVTIQAYATGNQAIGNVTVRDILPANLLYRNSLTVDGLPNSGNITAGINLDGFVSGQAKVVTYQVQVAPAQNFPFGTTTLQNAISVNSPQGGTATSFASIFVTRSGVLGVTDVPTGPLTGNFWVDSLFLPIALLLAVIWFATSGTLGMPKWVLAMRGKYRNYASGRQLNSKIAWIKKNEDLN